jgi:hypothetical protein|tara:strand:+ start:1066 stop:2250 length:1185 start_codon:yes stop_codon:yes gene_type:complete
MSELKEEVKQEGDFKIKSKSKLKKFSNKTEEPAKVDLAKDANVKIDEPTKVDLTKKPEADAIQVGETKKVDVGEQAGDGEIVDIGGDKPVEESSPIIEEIQEVGEKPLPKQEQIVQPKVELPDNVEKLVAFMKETGGTIEDYTRLNADYSDVDEDTLLREYYKNTKPHLSNDDLSFVMEENFSFDTDLDEERDIRKKKLAKKEEIAKAKKHLEDVKVKYYDEIKLRPSVNQDQQNAMDFFNRYNKDQELATQQHERFVNDTNTLFSDDFKGFDFEVGEKKFRYGVKDPSNVAENQSNINNFVEKFLDTEGNVKDTKGYHKAMYAAQNVDRIVKHFYEQGKTDGIKNVMQSSKNPTLDAPRQGAGQDITLGGFKVRAVDGVDSSKLKIKTSKFNN